MNKESSVKYSRIRAFAGNRKNIRFLILRMKPLGDTILTTPVYYALKKAYPECRITVVIAKKFTEVMHNNPHVDEILEYDRGSYLVFLFRILFRKFDISIDFNNNPRSAQLTLMAWAKFRIGRPKGRNFFYNLKIPMPDDRLYIVEKNLHLCEPLGIPTSEIKYFYIPDDGSTAFARQLLSEKSPGRDIIGLYVSGSAKTQIWAFDRYIALGKKVISELNRDVMILYGPQDRMLIETLQKDDPVSREFIIPPPVTINQLGALIKNCSVLVTGDGGPKHMSVSLDVPTITIFGSISSEGWNPPDTERFPFLASDIECYPCFDKKVCRYDTYDCLKGISVTDVYSVLARLLEKGRENDRDTSRANDRQIGREQDPESAR